MSSASLLLLSAHLAATTAMMGLIWFVQVVHYPLFAGVGDDRFVHYAGRHQHLTSLVVGPPMAIEGVTALILLIAPPVGVGRALPLLGAALAALVYASTVLLQVPHHSALAAGYDADRVRRLVRTNWIRTLGWTARGVVAVAMLVTVGR